MCSQRSSNVLWEENICRRGGKTTFRKLILITELISYVSLLLVDSWGNCKCLAILNVEMGKVSVLYPGLTERLIKGKGVGNVSLLPAFHQSKARHQSHQFQMRVPWQPLGCCEMMLYSLLICVYVHISCIVSSFIRGFVCVCGCMPMCDLVYLVYKMCCRILLEILSILIGISLY